MSLISGSHASYERRHRLADWLNQAVAAAPMLSGPDGSCTRQDRTQFGQLLQVVQQVPNHDVQGPALAPGVSASSASSKA